MNTHILNTLEAALQAYGQQAQKDAKPLIKQLLNVFSAEKAYMEKVSDLDKAFDDQPSFEALREVMFDLLLINFFTDDVNKLEEDYLDSPEWEAIEEETLDRGTELLNVLLYLKECQDEDIEPELSDFLKEFLLVDEDEFQDEHRIYEEVIANQILMESSVNEIAKVAEKIKQDTELKDLFYPMMCFFRNPQPSAQEQEEVNSNAIQPAFDIAVYQLLINFNHQ
ncbi:MAG: hypothetical protein RLZ47_1232 [Bacteroidota bacterium]|jgi:hypothetical protein